MSFRLEQKKAFNLNQRLMVTAVIKNGNRYLLVKRSSMHAVQRGKWQFPEGGVEFGEHPEKTLYRELKEETGLKIKSSELLGVTSYVIRKMHADIYHVVRMIYSVKTSGKIKLNKENSESGWFTKAQIKKLPLMWLRYESIKKMI